MHTLQLELNGRALLDSPEIIIADIRDETRIRQVFRAVRPRCRLPRRRAQAPAAARAAPRRGREDERARHPERGAGGGRGPARSGFLLISTDKAAEPRSILGATKRLAEMIVQANADGKMRVCSVRFGNVLGSRGSLLDRGRRPDRARRAGHGDRSRRHPVLHDGRGSGGPGPVGGADGANSARRSCWTWASRCGSSTWSAGTPSSSRCRTCRSDFTGLRPGEKLHETLFGELEERLPTVNPAISATRPGRLPDDFAGSSGPALRRGRERR